MQSTQEEPTSTESHQIPKPRRNVPLWLKLSDESKHAWKTPAPFDDYELSAVWRLFTFNWRLLVSFIGVFVAGLIATEFYIRPSSYLIAFAMAAMRWRRLIFVPGNSRSEAVQAMINA
jgi:hypothetical protein